MTTTTPRAELAEPVRAEALLDRFNRVLRRLYAAAAVVGDDKAERLVRHLLRQTLTTQLISETYLVAVAGMQGAGKTTLVRQLYDLDFTWLPENLGRGEKMPVFIVENGRLTAPRAFAVEVGDEHGTLPLLRTVEVDRDAWIEGLRGRRNLLIARLEVPPKVFGVDGAGLLLLPGFEPYGEPQWQNLMQQALIASPSTMVVTDPSHLASPAALDIMRRMQEQYLAGRHPIVVVSHCEAVGDEAADGLRQSAATAFRVPSDAVATNVILSGDTDEHRARWRPVLMNALRENARSGEQARRQQVRHLQEVVRNEGADLLDLFTQDLEEWMAGNETTDEKYRDQLRHFDEEAYNLGLAFQKMIKSVLDGQLTRAKNNMGESLRGHEGWSGIGRRLIDFVAIRAAQRESELMAAIERSWRDARADFSKDAEKLRDDAIARVLGYVDPDLRAGPEEQAATSAHEHTALRDVVQSVGDLARLDTSDDAEVTPQAMRLLPAMAYELMTFSATRAASIVTADPPADAEQWATVLNDLTMQRRELLTALVSFVGVELAADAQIDSITGLAQALHRAFSPAVAAGATVSATAAAAATAVIAVVSAAVLLNYANRSDLGRRRAVMSTLQAIRDEQWTRYDAAFTETMLQIRAIVAARLRIYYRVDDERERIWTLQKVISDFRHARLDLLDACGDDLTALG